MCVDAFLAICEIFRNSRGAWPNCKYTSVHAHDKSYQCYNHPSYTATKPSRTNEQSEHAKLKILRDNLRPTQRWAPTINNVQKAE